MSIRYFTPLRFTTSIDLYHGCNIACEGCKRWHRELALPKAVTREQGHSQLESVAALGFKAVLFAGGELSLWEPFPEIISFAVSKGLKTCWITNGTRLPVTDAAYQSLTSVILSWDQMHCDETNRRGLRSPHESWEVLTGQFPHAARGITTVISSRDIDDPSFIYALSDCIAGLSSPPLKWNLHPLYSSVFSPRSDAFRALVESIDVRTRGVLPLVDNYPYSPRVWPVMRTNDEVQLTVTDSQVLSRAISLGYRGDVAQVRALLQHYGFLSKRDSAS